MSDRPRSREGGGNALAVLSRLRGGPSWAPVLIFVAACTASRTAQVAGAPAVDPQRALFEYARGIELRVEGDLPGAIRHLRRAAILDSEAVLVRRDRFWAADGNRGCAVPGRGEWPRRRQQAATRAQPGRAAPPGTAR